MMTEVAFTTFTPPPPLEYRSPFELRRPGILIAVATFSLVYATLSLLISALSASTDIYRLNETLSPAPPPPPPPSHDPRHRTHCSAHLHIITTPPC